MRPREFLTICTCVLLVAAVACRRSEKAQAGSTPTGGGEVEWDPSIRAETIGVTDIEVGTGLREDQHVDKSSLELSPKDTFAFALVTQAPMKGAKVRAFATYADATPVLDQSRVVRTDGPAATAFQVSPPTEGWRAGWYQVRFLVNDESVGTRDFQVK